MKVKEIVVGKIKKITKTYLLVKLQNGYQGVLHISEVSDYYVYHLNKIFEIGFEYDFEVLNFDPKLKKVTLSWKTITPRFMRNPFNFEIGPTKNGFVNLKKSLRRFLND